MKASPQTAISIAAFMLLVLAAPHAFASHVPKKSIEDMVAESAVVLVGQVTRIDASDEGRLDGRTRVAVSVRDVLHGRVDDVTTSLVFDGGELPDGTSLWHGGVPDLQVGRTYVMFLQGDYYVSPFIRAVDSVLQVVNVGGREVMADRNGLAAVISPTHGLLLGDAIAPEVAERVPHRRPERRKTARSAGPLTSDAQVISAHARPIEPSSYQEAVEVLRDIAKRSGGSGGTLSAGPRPFPYGKGDPSTDPPAPSVPQDGTPNDSPVSLTKPKTAFPEGVAP